MERSATRSVISRRVVRGSSLPAITHSPLRISHPPHTTTRLITEDVPQTRNAYLLQSPNSHHSNLRDVDVFHLLRLFIQQGAAGTAATQDLMFDELRFGSVIQYDTNHVGVLRDYTTDQVHLIFMIYLYNWRSKLLYNLWQNIFTSLLRNVSNEYIISIVDNYVFTAIFIH